jgi:hypothetical protein
MSGGQMQVPARHSNPLQHCPAPVHEYPRGTQVHWFKTQLVEQQSELLVHQE